MLETQRWRWQRQMCVKPITLSSWKMWVLNLNLFSYCLLVMQRIKPDLRIAAAAKINVNCVQSPCSEQRFASCNRQYRRCLHSTWPGLYSGFWFLVFSSKNGAPIMTNIIQPLCKCSSNRLFVRCFVLSNECR